MYFHLYDNDLCKKSKSILLDPLKINPHNFQKRKFFNHFVNSLLSKEYRLKTIVYSSYKTEQKFILENHQIIVSELNELNIRQMYKKYNSPLHNYLLDSISDYYNLSMRGTKTESIYLEKLMSFFYMNELLFYISNKNVKLLKTNNVISISPMHNEYKYLKRRWFAYIWEKESKDANVGLSVFANLTIPKEKIVDAVLQLSNMYMDKVFFMHDDYISTQNKKKEQYIFIHNLCKFFLLLHLTKDYTVSTKDPILKLLKLNKNNFMNELNKINATQPFLDKGFFIANDSYVLDKSLDVYNVLKSYLIEKYQKKLSVLSSKFGQIFEEYIKLYTQKNLSSDYRIIADNIDYNENEINVDIDLTLYDKNRDYYYFIQAKYAVSNKPYLKDEIKSICNNKTLKKGLKQLNGFREALNQDSFQEILKSKKINVNDDNFSLILIHTISQFDFHEVNDIQLYEWNNFRNLLDKGKQQNMNINLEKPTHDIVQHLNTLALENVDDVIQTSMDNGSRDYDSLWNEFKNGFFKFKLNNNLFESNIK